jgi:outer membrane protein
MTEGEAMYFVRRSQLLFLVGIPVFALAAASLHGESRSLGLREAVALALSEQGNPQVRLAEEAVAESRARAAEVRSGLLPQVAGSVAQRRQTVNLEAQGLDFARAILPSTLVGPFSTFDARGSVNQVVFNWSLFQRFRSAREAIRTSELAGENVRDSVAGATASAYLAVLRDRARVETATANRDLARELLDLARHQLETGTGIAVEVTRAEVKLSQQEQVYLAAREAHATSLLRLKRWLGVELTEDLILTDDLEQPSDLPIPNEQAAVDRALEHRSDLQSQLSRLEAARRAYSAAKAERMPALVGFANYGTIGPGAANSIPTWAAGVTLEIPIFDGGAMDARRGEESIRVREERVKVQDLQEQIGLEVRLALSALRLARDQLTVADQGKALAERELQQAERRYRAGVTTSLEVTEAQTHLAEADESRLSALYRFNLSRIQLAESTGTLIRDLNP